MLGLYHSMVTVLGRRPIMISAAKPQASVEPRGSVETETTLRILLADDHEVIRRGLRQLIERRAGWEVCGEATTGEQTVKLAGALKPGIVILDLSMPGFSSIEITRLLRTTLPNTEVLIFTMQEGEEMMRELIGAGARSYVLKSDPTSHIVAAIEALASHRPFFTAKISETLRDAFQKTIDGTMGKSSPSLLSSREREIIQLLAEGESNKEVSKHLGISVKTVETHRATIMRKLEINSVVELVHYAVRNKIILP